MTRGEVLAARRQDHHPNGVIGLGTQERLVELHQQATALRVVGFGPVEPDPGNAALVEGFIGHQLIGAGMRRLSSSFSVGLFGASPSPHLPLYRARYKLTSIRKSPNRLFAHYGQCR